MPGPSFTFAVQYKPFINLESKLYTARYCTYPCVPHTPLLLKFSVILRVADPDPHFFEKLVPDADQNLYKSEKLDPDLYKSQNS